MENFKTCDFYEPILSTLLGYASFEVIIEWLVLNKIFFQTWILKILKKSFHKVLTNPELLKNFWDGLMSQWRSKYHWWFYNSWAFFLNPWKRIKTTKPFLIVKASSFALLSSSRCSKTWWDTDLIDLNCYLIVY